MYCPKCGAQNQEDLAYCRECGENLKIISQVMKKHLPIALVSKLDAVIERKNERLRRDAILCALMGTIVILAVTITSGKNAFFSSVLGIYTFLTIGIFTLVQSGWYFLAYRRSLELRKISSDIPIKGEWMSPLFSRIKNSPELTEAVTNKLVAVNNSQSASIYCPRCGVQNAESVAYCSDCGTSLDFSVQPQGMERILPAFLLNKLDARIEKNEQDDYKPTFKSGWGFGILTLLFLFNAIMAGIDGNWEQMTINLVLGFVVSITQGWELVAYRRELKKKNKSSDKPATPLVDEFKTFISTPLFRAAAILICIFTVIPFVITGGGIFGFLALIIFAGLITTFIQHRNSVKDEESPNDSTVLLTSKLLPQDTLPLASPTLGINEATTEYLQPAILREENDVQTTQILDKQRR